MRLLEETDLPSRLSLGVLSAMPANASLRVAMMMGPASDGIDSPRFTSVCKATSVRFLAHAVKDASSGVKDLEMMVFCVQANSLYFVAVAEEGLTILLSSFWRAVPILPPPITLVWIQRPWSVQVSWR